MRRWGIITGIALALSLLGWGLRAQIGNIVANTLSENECWQATQGASNQGPGGAGIFVCSFLYNNTQGALNVTATTGTVNATTQTADYIFTQALTGGVTFNAVPAPVPNGFIVEIVNGTASNFTSNITFTASGTQTLVGSGTITNLSANTSKEFRYLLSTNTWYLMR